MSCDPVYLEGGAVISAEARSRFKDELRAEVDKGHLPGAVVAMSVAGEVFLLEAVGWSDPEARHPMSTETLFWLASATKPITSVAVLLLSDKGKVRLTDSVEDYLPELAGMRVAKDGAVERSRWVAPERAITLLDLATHTSGVSEAGFDGSPAQRLYAQFLRGKMGNLSEAELLSKISELPLLHQPGRGWTYGLGHDLLGIIVDRVSGYSLGTFMRDQLFGPLGMHSTGFEPAEAAYRVARPFRRDPLTGFPQSVDFSGRIDLGGSGLLSNAGDFLRFVNGLLGYALPDARPLMSDAVRGAMFRQHVTPAQFGAAPWNGGFKGYGFGLGLALRTSRSGAAVKDATWPGGSGVVWWCDPSRALAVVFMAHTPGALRWRYRRLLRRLVNEAISGARSS